MMRRAFARMSVAAAALLALAVLSPALGAEPTELRYKWRKGDQIRQRMTMVQNSSTDGVPGAGKLEQKQTQEVVLTLDVKDTDEKGAGTVEMRYRSMRFELEQPAGKQVFDSSQPPDPAAANHPMSKLVKALLDKPITLVIEPLGDVSSVQGATAIFDDIARDIGAADPNMGRAMGDLKPMFTDDALKKLFQTPMKILPAVPVDKGDTWQSISTTSMPQVGILTLTTDFTLSSIAKKADSQIAFIQGKVGFVLTGGSTLLPQGGSMAATLDSSSGSNENEFDVQRGQLSRGVTKVNMKMTFKVQQPGADGVVTLHQTTDSSTIIEALPPEPAKPASAPAPKPDAATEPKK